MVNASYFICPKKGCTRRLDNPGSLRAHLDTHDGTYAFICSVNGCGKGFETKQQFLQHLRGSVHKLIVQDNVDSFNAGTGKPSAKYANIQLPPRIQRLSLRCKIKGCQHKKGFGTQESLQEHTASRHIQCPVCAEFMDYGSSIKNLLSHMEARHPDEHERDVYEMDLVHMIDIIPVFNYRRLCLEEEAGKHADEDNDDDEDEDELEHEAEVFIPMTSSCTSS